MEPRQNGPSLSGESAPAYSGERQLYPNSDLEGSKSPEHTQETRPELGAVKAEIAQVVMLALPTPVTAQDDNAGASYTGSSSVPAVAGDEDLIEKEWVDKAKKIITDTKDDPYKREREISKLQIEYIRKRYGREVGDAGD